MIDHVQKKILDRYAQHKRELPRRDTFDGYKVLVSEIMLQQTQVERVMPKFLRFIETLPSFETLAHIDKSTLLGLRSWLGFNSRALRLQRCAQILIDEHQGILPKTRQLLRTLPGIWSYTSWSLLAFTYNIAVPVVDTNIRRVYIAEFGLPETISPLALESVVLATIPDGRANDRYNALMDYGSTVLTVKKTGIKPLSKQSRFTWSRRQIRGKVLKHLVHHWPSAKKLLQSSYQHAQFSDIIEEMMEEWLITEKKGMLSIE